MTKEQQRIAIAEWAGFKRVKVFAWSEDGKTRLPFQYIDESHLPNYPEDLNAMHEAEKKLGNWTMPMESETIVDKYIENLVDVCCEAELEIYYAHSTAAQRSEALCRTLWPERFQ